MVTQFQFASVNFNFYLSVDLRYDCLLQYSLPTVQTPTPYLLYGSSPGGKGGGRMAQLIHSIQSTDFRIWISFGFQKATN